MTADAGYGSEQNYQWLEDRRITGYVKHNYFDRMQNKTINSKEPYAIDKLSYDIRKDIYLCPVGQPMKNIGSKTTKNKNGFEQTLTKYEGPKM